MKISLENAADLLLKGNVVAVPTETVYGLAACLHELKAIEKIFLLKNRPPNNPLIIHLSNLSDLKSYVKDLPPFFNALAKKFWPGPLTFVLPIDETSIPKLVRAGLTTAAFRIPNHVVAQNLIHKTGPLVMPSANLSGKPSSTLRQHVENDFGESFPVLEGEICQYGIESTILIYHKNRWEIGRQGAISSEQIEEVLGYPPKISEKKENSPLCPGQLYRHYSPNAKLHMDASIPDSVEVVLGFSDRAYGNRRIFILGDSRNPSEVAHELYKNLRKLDEENISEAWVDMNFPKEDLWKSIRERLEKAASKL